MIAGCGDDDGAREAGQFELLGPRDVGYPHAFVFDTRSPGTVYFGGDDATGVHRSRDGGRTWTKLDALGVRSGWALDVGADGRLYVGDWYGTGIFVSEDEGESFFGAEGIDFPFSYIGAIAADPADANVAYAVAGFPDGKSDGENGDGPLISSRGAVFRTVDGGAHWARLDLDVDTALADVAIDPNDPDVLLVTAEADVWRSTNGGDSFEHIDTTAGGKLAFSSTEAGVVIAAGAAVMRSDDGGASWTGTSAPNGLFADVAASPTEDAFFVFGLTENGGAFTQSVGNAGTVWEDVIDPLFAGVHLGGAVDPEGGSLLVGTFGEGVVRFDRESEEWGRSSTGTIGAECDGVVALSGAPERLVVACGNLTFAPYVALSDDDGEHWSMAEGPFEPGALDVVMPLVADHDDDDVLLVGGNAVRRSTDRGATWTTVVENHSFALTQGVDGAIYAAGLPFLRSTDHGQTFTEYGAISCDAWHVAADPHAAGHVFATCPDAGFFETENGETWERIALEVPDFSYAALVADPSTPEHLAAALRQEGGRRLDGRVFVSTTGGETWSDVTPDLECAFVAAILYLSDAPGHLIVGTQSADHYCPTIDGQLLESFDNGSTWRDATANLGPPQIHSGGLFEGREGTLYVSTWDGGIFRRRP